MIKRVFEITLGGGESPMYYCTVCNRPYKALHEANEHAKFCGQAVPTQPVFRSYTTAATFEDTEFDGRIGDDDDDTQVYKKPWVGLTDEDIMSCSDSQRAAVMYFAAMLKKKNA